MKANKIISAALMFLWQQLVSTQSKQKEKIGSGSESLNA